jgi:hypothetical protein
MNTIDPLRIFRYLGSLFFLPIVRGTMRMFGYFQRFGRVEVGGWTFSGPANFVNLVETAWKRLECEDLDILRGMTDAYTVMYSHERFFSWPSWRYGGIPDSYIAWKSDGVVAAWVYLYFHLLQFKKGRWFLTIAENSRKADREATRRTREWLELHQFPEGLREAFVVRDASN